MKAFYFTRYKLNPKPLRGAGGISIYLKNEMVHVPFMSIVKSQDDYLIWLEITMVRENGKPSS